MELFNTYNIKDKKAITLIALVITIVIILILCGITYSIVLGPNGMIATAKEQKVIQTNAEILEQLELAKGQVAIDGRGTTELQKYLDYIQTNGLNNHTITRIVRDEDGVNSTIIVDEEYIYTAAQIGKDVVINAVGNVEQATPEIQLFEVIEETTNSIKVKVEAKMAEKYEFYIKENEEYKKVGEQPSTQNGTYNLETIEYTYVGLSTLQEGNSYVLKVIAINGKEQAEREIDSQLENMAAAEGNVTFTSNPAYWTNVNVTTSIETKLTQYNLEYQINATTDTIKDNSKWIEYKEPIVSTQNETIYVRLSDGVNAGTYATHTISNIDKLDPIGSIDVITTTNSAKVTVNAADQEATAISGKSGIAKYYYSKDGGNNYIESTSNTFTFTQLDQTTDYSIKVKVLDNAGNTIIIDRSGETLTVAKLQILVSEPDKWKKKNNHNTSKC